MRTPSPMHRTVVGRFHQEPTVPHRLVPPLSSTGIEFLSSPSPKPPAKARSHPNLRDPGHDPFAYRPRRPRPALSAIIGGLALSHRPKSWLRSSARPARTVTAALGERTITAADPAAYASRAADPDDCHLDLWMGVRSTQFLYVRPSPRAQTVRDVRLSAILVVLANNQAATRRNDSLKKVADKTFATVTWDVLKTRSDEIKTHWRLPSIGVRGPDPCPPSRITLPCEISQAGRDLQAVGLYGQPFLV
jgi:hypothetical protein